MKDIVLHSIAGMARSIFMKAAQGSLLLKKGDLTEEKSIFEQSYLEPLSALPPLVYPLSFVSTL